MTTLQEFRSNVKDIARPNRWLLAIEGPAITQFTLPTNFQFLVSKAQIPKRDTTGPIMKYRGTSLTLSGDYKKDPLVMTLWNDIEWKARDFFENWLDFLHKITEDNIRTDLTDSRFSNSIIIRPLGPELTNLDDLAKYRFKEIMPVEISEIELDQGTENGLQEFTVSFQYSHWVRELPTIGSTLVL